MKKKTIIGKKYELDAKGLSLGRLASKVAFILQGKNEPSYRPNVDSGHEVLVKNLSLLKFTGKKFTDKKYFRFSGYPGGIQARSLAELFTKDPYKVIRQTVYNMLPKNRLRASRINRLKVEK